MFTQEEIENLISLIQSPVADNVKLAFAMLESKKIPTVIAKMLEDYKELYPWWASHITFGIEANLTLEEICERVNQKEEITCYEAENIPNSVYLFHNLKTFTTYEPYVENTLKTLPDTFGQLKNLEVLDLAKNEFQQIPSVIRKLKKLRHLGFFANAIKEIPEWMGELDNLEYLDLRGNPLEKLPESLTKCKKLKEIRLGHNKFSEEEKTRIKAQFSYVKELIL